MDDLFLPPHPHSSSSSLSCHCPWKVPVLEGKHLTSFTHRQTDETSDVPLLTGPLGEMCGKKSHLQSRRSSSTNDEENVNYFRLCFTSSGVNRAKRGSTVTGKTMRNFSDRVSDLRTHQHTS